MIEKEDIIFFDNPFSLRHNLNMLLGKVVGILEDSVLVKTCYGVTEVSNKHIVAKYDKDNPSKLPYLKKMINDMIPFLVDNKSIDRLLDKAQEQVYKTFDDLEFKVHEIVEEISNMACIPPYIRKITEEAKYAVIDFDNGYGVKVLFGNIFHSNGVDTYEMAVLKNGELCMDSPVSNDILGYLSKDMVSEIMINVQKLPKGC